MQHCSSETNHLLRKAGAKIRPQGHQRAIRLRASQNLLCFLEVLLYSFVNKARTTRERGAKREVLLLWWQKALHGEEPPRGCTARFFRESRGRQGQPSSAPSAGEALFLSVIGE